MLTKAKAKSVKSLQVKKYRFEEQCFVVEGEKGVLEALTSPLKVRSVIALDSFLAKHQALLVRSEEVVTGTGAQMESLSSQVTSPAAIAVVRMLHRTLPPAPHNEFFLAVDGLRDPGNLGTMIRTADWFGVRVLLASEDTADCYNPKVVQASMGSITRVEVHYTDLSAYLTNCPSPVLGAFLDGEDVHQTAYGREGIIVVGNEARGISPQVAALVNRRITIPRYGGAESLNAAVAASIILDNLRRLK
jgi:TrmH family RNA methyltransferase